MQVSQSVRNAKRLGWKGRRLPALALAVFALVFSLAGTAGADSSAPNLVNQATATVTGVHQDSQDLAWSLAQVNQPSVTAVNDATATATNCLTCTAVAVAFQIVLASNTNTFTITNNATSMNTNCVNCTTVSVAEQWVVGDTSQQLRLNFIGQWELFAVHLQLAFWSHTPPSLGLPHILALANQVSTILSNDVVEVPTRSAPVPKPAVSPLTTPTVSPLAAPAPSGPQITHYAQVSQ